MEHKDLVRDEFTRQANDYAASPQIRDRKRIERFVAEVAPDLSARLLDVACGPGHALRFEPERDTGGLKPYLHVRRELWAKVTRALFFDLVEMGEEREVEGRAMFGVASGGVFFPMAPAEQVRDFV